MIGYMISDDAEKVLRVLVDTDARPLWLPSVREGTPDRYNGYPVVVNGSMADVTSGNIPMLFGNFSYYGIRTVRAFELFRFMDSAARCRRTPSSVSPSPAATRGTWDRRPLSAR